VNGDVVGVVLFGGMLAFSFVGMKVAQKRAVARLGQEGIQQYKVIASGSLVDRLKRSFSVRFAGELLAGILAFFALLFAHEYLIGVSPLAYF